MEKQKFYRAKWFLWVCLIFLPPIGLILLWTCHKQMKNVTRIILSVIFALWFIILLVSRNGAKDGVEDGLAAAGQPTATPQVTQGSEPAQGAGESTQKPMPREISVQDAEDACLSFFVEIVMNAYDEIPWGEGTENGVIIESDYSVESQSGAVTISYTLMDAPNAGTHIVINFILEGDKVGVSEVLVDEVKQDLPKDAKDSVLIWLLLDANYKG